ncbi:MAG: ribosome biogenesis GTPase YlqF [Bacillota bacterium]|nr:ribosome biogenesis GTPase YlqF [Bacillota bacterium]
MTVVNWYPGHMAKAGKEVKKQVALCDLILEIGDARLPESSRNPELKKIIGNKKTVFVINKADLTEKPDRDKWLAYYEEKGVTAVFVAARKKMGFKELNMVLDKEIKALNAAMVERGRRPRPLRVMMVGIPNTGKSALLNALAGSNKVKTGNKPGLTRAVQWVRTGDNWELLDSPGILWPKLEDQEAALKLAVVGSISKDACPEEESGWYLLNWLISNKPRVFQERYKVSSIPEYPEELLEMVARSRGLVRFGGIRELETYIMLLKEFRDGKMGRLMLELP